MKPSLKEKKHQLQPPNRLKAKVNHQPKKATRSTDPTLMNVVGGQGISKTVSVRGGVELDTKPKGGDHFCYTGMFLPRVLIDNNSMFDLGQRDLISAFVQILHEKSRANDPAGKSYKGDGLCKDHTKDGWDGVNGIFLKDVTLLELTKKAKGKEKPSSADIERVFEDLQLMCSDQYKVEYNYQYESGVHTYKRSGSKPLFSYEISQKVIKRDRKGNEILGRKQLIIKLDKVFVQGISTNRYNTQLLNQTSHLREHTKRANGQNKRRNVSDYLLKDQLDKQCGGVRVECQICENKLLGVCCPYWIENRKKSAAKRYLSSSIRTWKSIGYIDSYTLKKGVYTFRINKRWIDQYAN